MDYLHETILKVWNEDIRNDYEKSYLLKEDTLKNAFYFHLRRRLGEEYLLKNNLRLFTEYYIKSERVDLVVVEIDPDKAEVEHLSKSVVGVVAAIEIKYKISGTSELRSIQKDAEKILRYINDWGEGAKFYMAVIHEDYYTSKAEV